MRINIKAVHFDDSQVTDQKGGAEMEKEVIPWMWLTMRTQGYHTFSNVLLNGRHCLFNLEPLPTAKYRVQMAEGPGRVERVFNKSK